MTHDSLKLGDLVACWPHGSREISMCVKGIIVGFNDKGLGGADFVRVLCNGEILTFMSFDIEVIK